MLKALTNFKIHQNLLKYWFTLLHFVMDDPVLLLLQDIIKVDWCRKECGVVWPVQLCQTATMAGIYKFCPKIMRLFPSQTSEIWFSTPFKVIFWSETVKTNVSTKLRDSNIHWFICQICHMIFGQNLEIPIIVQQSQKSKVSLVMTIIKESYVQCRFSPQLLDKCW